MKRNLEKQVGVYEAATNTKKSITQSPQRPKALREHALIESAVSSNHIEGVAVEPSRVREVLDSPKPLFRDRDEEVT